MVIEAFRKQASRQNQRRREACFPQGLRNKTSVSRILAPSL